MTTASDVMTPNPITLDSSTAILDAVKLFIEKKISSVPVFSTMGDIAGQLTELVLVRIMVMYQLQPEKYSKLAHCVELLEPAHFADPTDSITTVLKTIIKSPSRRVLVRSNGRKILGIISPKDLLKVLMADSADAKSIQTAIGAIGKKI